MTAGRMWIPARPIERPMLRGRDGLAPRIGSTDTRRRAVRGSLELGFRRQPNAAPLCVRRGLCMAHVNGPRERQRNQIEHAAPVPCGVVVFPEKRMAHVFGLYPGPVIG